MVILSLSAPLNSMNPRFLNLFMNTLTLERLAPIMSASASAVVLTSSLLVSLGFKCMCRRLPTIRTPMAPSAASSSRCYGSMYRVSPSSMGAEMNAVIEHASPMGRDPGETMACGGTG